VLVVMLVMMMEVMIVVVAGHSALPQFRCVIIRESG
jgi:hypothetical protein